MICFDVLMCSDLYAALWPASWPKFQSPPTSLAFSKQSNGMPASCSCFAAAMPDDPAPITQTFGQFAGRCVGHYMVPSGTRAVNTG